MIRNYRTIAKENPNLYRTGQFSKEDMFKESFILDRGINPYDGVVYDGRVWQTNEALMSQVGYKTTSWFPVIPGWQYWKIGGDNFAYQIKSSSGVITLGGFNDPDGVAYFESMPVNSSAMRITFTLSGQNIIPTIWGYDLWATN